MTAALQRSDPRCGEPELQSGDSWELFKLKSLVVLGSVVETVKGWF